MNCRIKTLSVRHYPDVQRIFSEGLKTGMATFETRTKSPEEWEKSMLECCRLGAFSASDELCGWAALSPVSKREVYRGVAEVSVYIAEVCRGRGIGKQLLQALVDCSEKHGIRTLQSSILPENKGSLLIHERYGFRQVGYREKIARLHGQWKDTLLLERRSTVI